MCWFARIRVVSVEDKRLASQLRISDDAYGELSGLWNGTHCACGLVLQDGREVVGVLPGAVDELVRQPAVKRVEVMWWWTYRVNDPARWGRGWVPGGA